jgi:hypothetical protein
MKYIPYLYKTNRTVMKIKTSKQLLASLVKELTDMDAALVRDRLLASSKEVLAKEESLREDMKNSIINPDLFINTMRRVQEALKY